MALSGSIIADSFTVAGNSTWFVQPPSGSAYQIEHAGATVWQTFVDTDWSTPDMGVGWYVSASPGGGARSREAGDYTEWSKDWRVIANNEIPLLMRNMKGANNTLAYMGTSVDPDRHIVGTVVEVAAGTRTIIQPTAGSAWIITEYGVDKWDNTSGTKSPGGAIGSQSSSMVNSDFVAVRTHRSTWLSGKKMRLCATNDFPIQLYNQSGVISTLGFSGIYVSESMVRHDIVDTAASSEWIIQIPEDETWALMEYGSQTWTNASPAQVPHMSIRWRTSGSTDTGVDNPPIFQAEPSQPFAARFTTNVFFDKNMELLLKNIDAGGPRHLMYSAIKVPNIIATSSVFYNVDDVPQTIQPPTGSTWMLNMMSNSGNWVGDASNMTPDIHIGYVSGSTTGGQSAFIRKPGVKYSWRWNTRIILTNDIYVKLWSPGTTDLGFSCLDMDLLTNTEGGNGFLNIVNGSTALIQPPSGSVWEVFEQGANRWTWSGGSTTGYHVMPEICIGIADPVNIGTTSTADLACFRRERSGQRENSGRPLHMVISNDIIGYITATHFAQNVGYSYLDLTNSPISESFASSVVEGTSAGASVQIQPPSGSEYILLDFGSDTALWGGTRDHPNMEWYMDDVYMIRPDYPEHAMPKPTLRWDDSMAIKVKNTSSGTMTMGWSMQEIKPTT